MRPMETGTGGWIARIVLLALLLAGAAVPAAAQTCPSADGTGYTYVYPGSGPDYNLNPGESLLIQSGTYTGNLNGPAAGALVCVNAGATFQPGTVNNMAGTVQNQGTSVLANVNFNGGASLDNRAGEMTFNNTNANGPITVTNAAGATMFGTGGNLTIPGGSTVLNEGRVEIVAGTTLELQANSTTTNSSVIIVNGGNLNLAGNIVNTGYIEDFGDIHVNGGSFTNECSIVATEFINSGSLTNNGHLIVTTADGGPFTNHGTLSQGVDGVIVGVTFGNEGGSVSGVGRYYFTGHTENQGAFNGSNPADPIVFYDASQSNPPQIFDLQNAAPTNTIRISFDPPSVAYARLNCTPPYPDEPTSDVSVTKEAQSDALRPGGTVTYTLTAHNDGPDGAEGTLLTDDPDDGLTCTAVTCTGASDGATCPAVGTGPGELSIDNLLGAGVALDLPIDGQIVFELTCTVAATP